MVIPYVITKLESRILETSVTTLEGADGTIFSLCLCCIPCHQVKADARIANYSKAVRRARQEIFLINIGLCPLSCFVNTVGSALHSL